MKNNKLIKVYLAAVLYSVIVGLSFLFSKIGLQYSNPLDLLAYRFTFAFVAVLLAVKFKILKVNINRKLVKKILPIALFYPLLSFGFQIFGLQFIQSSEAGIISAVGPIFTMIIASYFLKEKTNTLQKISIIVSVSGVLFIIFNKEAAFQLNSFKGLIFTLISVVSLSVFNVVGRKLRKDVTNSNIIMVIITVGFIVFNVIAIGKHVIDGDIVNFFTPLKNPNFIFSMLYLGILSSLLTSYLTIFSLSHLEAYKMSVFGNFSTVISIIAGALILKEEILLYHIIGSVLIIGGVIGVNFLGTKKVKVK